MNIRILPNGLYRGAMSPSVALAIVVPLGGGPYLLYPLQLFIWHLADIHIL